MIRGTGNILVKSEKMLFNFLPEIFTVNMGTVVNKVQLTITNLPFGRQIGATTTVVCLARIHYMQQQNRYHFTKFRNRIKPFVWWRAAFTASEKLTLSIIPHTEVDHGREPGSAGRQRSFFNLINNTVKNNIKPEEIENEEVKRPTMPGVP